MKPTNLTKEALDGAITAMKSFKPPLGGATHLIISPERCRKLDNVTQEPAFSFAGFHFIEDERIPDDLVVAGHLNGSGGFEVTQTFRLSPLPTQQEE